MKLLMLAQNQPSILVSMVRWMVALCFIMRLRLSLECASTASTNLPEMDDHPLTTTPKTPKTSTAKPKCGRCPNLPIRMEDNSSRPIMLSRGTGEDGCPTITVNCAANSSDASTILTWYDSTGMDVGSTFGYGTVTAALQCTRNNTLLLMNGTVNEVECIAG